MKTMNGTAAKAAGAVLVAMASATVARGDTMTLTFENVSPGRAIGWSLNYGGSGTSSGGVYNWAGGVRTFCVQLEENITAGVPVTYDVVDPSMVPDGGAMNDPNQPGAMGMTKSSQLQTAYALWWGDSMMSSQNLSAAFQMVIWEISHEQGGMSGGYQITTGSARFTSNSAVETQATAWLDEINNRTLTGGLLSFSQLRGLTNVDRQDQLIVVPGAGSIAGLAGIAAISRRRRRG
jgi:hypothetical protein